MCIRDSSITFPVGATNNSTLVTGPLSINNIVVPDNTTDLGDGLGTAIITFEVTLDAAAQPGDLVNNTAGINNPAGIGANPAAQTLIVSPSLIPSTGNKILYIDTSGTDALSRNATIPNSSVTIAEQGGTITFAIDESLKKDLTLEAGPIPVSLWLSSSESNNKSRQIDVDLSYSGTSTGTIGSQTQSMNLNGTETQTDFYIDLASQITLLAGTSINLTVTNNIANNNRDADISSDTGPNPDEVNTIQLNASTVINVDSVDVYDLSLIHI